jgi:hypothetical protein
VRWRLVEHGCDCLSAAALNILGQLQESQSASGMQFHAVFAR